MKDETKTKKQLIEELEASRQSVAELRGRLREDQALERVRAEVASMKEATDLAKVIGVIDDALRDLGVRHGGLGINVVDEVSQEIRAYNRDGEIFIRESDARHPIWEEIVSYWRHGETWHRWHSEEVEPWLKAHATVDAPFSHGTLAMSKGEAEPFSDDEVRLAERCAEMLSLGYARYLDFERVNAAQRQLIVELEEELQTAHDMQMGLMPKAPPAVEGLDIAGRCLPANHVGGDFFQYFHQPDGRLAVTISDVTGHAMEAAIPAVMFSGILRTEMRQDKVLEQLYRDLNRRRMI